jgi:formylglycine-generating enzyme required for sulfatase activity
MPYIEGCTLSKILQDRAEVRAGKKVADPHPWATLSDKAYLEQILPVLDMVLESVVALHEAGVLHRDIKPSNILIDRRNNAWLSDFGLARLASQAIMTMPGEGMGTGGYMSPEQWEGKEDIDQLADVFSVGATLYKALTLELPYGKQRVTADAAPPVPASKRQPFLPRDFDAVLQKALEPERRNRYASAKELQEDWQRVRQGLLPRARLVGPMGRLKRTIRRRPWQMISALSVAILIGLLPIIFRPRDAQDRPVEEAPITRTVHLETEPGGAEVVMVPLDTDSGVPLPEKAIRPKEKTPENGPLIIEQVPPGEYLVVASIETHGFHEVFRTVPRAGQSKSSPMLHCWWDETTEGAIELPTIRIPDSNVVNGMALFPKGTFTMGSKDLPSLFPHEREVEAFYLECREVTMGEFHAIVTGLPTIMKEKGIPDSYPVRYVTFDQAQNYAERIGKRLPEEAEFEYAATNCGKTRFPWGDDASRIKDWPLGTVGEPVYDQTNTNPPVKGLYSNVAEWTSSLNTLYPGNDPEKIKRWFAQPVFREARVVRGGPYSVVLGKPDPLGKDKNQQWDARFRHGVSRNAAHPGLGFRCARSLKPRFLLP